MQNETIKSDEIHAILKGRYHKDYNKMEKRRSNTFADSP